MLGSVTGSPGVTTLAAALAAAWPRPAVLVEAAADGASSLLPGHLAGCVGHTRGIVDAAVAARAGSLADELDGLLIQLPSNPRARLLAGITRPEQASTMAGAWPLLADALTDISRRAGFDLIVDAGRLGQTGAPLPMLPIADHVLLVTGSDLPALHAARAWLPVLRAHLIDTSRLALLVVGEGRPYSAREIRRHLGAPMAGVVDHDPAGAHPWSHGSPSPRRPTAFSRSIAALLPSLAAAPGVTAPEAAS
jgi:hypothetical protein